MRHASLVGILSWFFLPAVVGLLITTTGVAQTTAQPSVHSIEPGDDAQYRLQARLIEAVPGDVIQLEEGRYELHRQLDVAADHVTIRGRGSDRTILSFRGQTAGGQGIEATGDGFTLEGLAVEDTSGNAVKVLGADGVVLRDVRTEWTGEAKSTNGAYGLYPVQCQNVLIEHCTAIGASDAGLYVGQCRNVIVRSSSAERNVAGIEIENTIQADVYDNVATNNTGGILIFDLPGLQVRAGRQVRVFRNRVIENNHPNFASPGNVVATVPAGTGVMVMATDEVEIFENELRGNQTGNLAILSYFVTGKKFNDPHYDPIPESVHVHDNKMSESGKRPSGEFGTLLRLVLGVPFPDMLFDGVVNSEALVNGQVPAERSHTIVNNGDATFVNFQLMSLQPGKILDGSYKLDRDLSPYASVRDSLPEVVLPAPAKPAAGASRAAQVYREAKRLLSEHGLFEGNGATQQPVAGVIPYDLNTPLFSDYTSKYRFIRLPPGEAMDYRVQGVFDFPVGTLIAKTFAYPVDMRDPSKGELLLETRIEERLADGWYGYAYRWNEAQTDAELVLGGAEMEVGWVHHDGTPRTNHYQIPNANQCLNCHQESGRFEPLGPVAANLNRPLASDEHGENQLAFLQRVGHLRGLPNLDTVDAWPRFDQTSSGDVEQRARAWLDVNCAHCHNPVGVARTSGLDLRIEQTDPAQYGVWKVPVAAGHGSGGREYDVVPGKPDESILMYRLESDDPSIAMPNVARRLVPTEAVELIREWILQMEVTAATSEPQAGEVR